MATKKKEDPKKYQTRSIARSKKRERLVEQAAALSTNPTIQNSENGWFPALIDEALDLYIKVKTETKEIVK